MDTGTRSSCGSAWWRRRASSWSSRTTICRSSAAGCDPRREPPIHCLLGPAAARDCAGRDFEECLREHGPVLWRVIASYAPRGPERDDLAQDVLVAVWLALPRFRGESSSSAKTFVLRVAHKRCLSHA